jgi:hypothetical protein
MKLQARLPDEPTVPPPAPPAANVAIDTATLDLLDGWRRQDATDNLEEIRAAERDLTEFKSAMNANRILAGEPILYP